MNLARAIDHTLLKPEATEPEIRYGWSPEAKSRTASPPSASTAGGSHSPAASCATPARILPPPRRRAQSKSAASSDSRWARTNRRSRPSKPPRPRLKDGGVRNRHGDHAGQPFSKTTLKRPAPTSSKSPASPKRRPPGDDTSKVILETAALTDAQIALGCRAATEGGADFVKTSTGFHPKGGATTHAVQPRSKPTRPHPRHQSLGRHPRRGHRPGHARRRRHPPRLLRQRRDPPGQRRVRWLLSIARPTPARRNIAPLSPSPMMPQITYGQLHPQGRIRPRRRRRIPHPHHRHFPHRPPSPATAPRPSSPKPTAKKSPPDSAPSSSAHSASTNSSSATPPPASSCSWSRSSPAASAASSCM